MRVEFDQGVPDGCAQWLRENVGPGNIEEDINNKRTRYGMIDLPEYAWFYERIEKIEESQGLCHEVYYVPTITVKDEKLATLFVLKWT